MQFIAHRGGYMEDFNEEISKKLEVALSAKEETLEMFSCALTKNEDQRLRERLKRQQEYIENCTHALLWNW